jgi:NAD(P)-dependent dehydrogenase (short-subunit alcohol dehydrogenase family)
MRLENKVALITGATGGMGSACARLFAQEGAAVVIAARKEELAHALAKEISDGGGKALFVKLDVANQEQWTAAVKKTKETFGALHILVNNAGVNTAAVLPYVDMHVWQDVLATNLTGPLMGIQACAPLMKESGGGSIINIGSIGGMTANFSTAYASSKWALRGLSGSAAFCLADWGIRSNLIEPGFIETNMTKNMPTSQVGDAVLLRRAGKDYEIAQAALFLASDESSYTTGSEILVDGGFYAPGPYLAAARKAGLLAMLQQGMEPADNTESEQGPWVLDKSLEGVYTVMVQFPTGNQEVVLDYHVEGAALTGTVTAAGNTAEIEHGKATHNGFAHQYRMKTPMGNVQVQVEGKVAGDTISGNLKTPMGSLPFEGTRE